MARLTGTLLECLSDYAKRTSKHNRKSFKQKRDIAKLLGVNPQTIHKWLDRGILPNGERLLRLFFLLDVCGYQVREAESLHPIIKQAGQVIAAGLMGANEMLARINLSSIDNFWRILLGYVGTTEEKMNILEQIYKEQESAVQDKKKTWAKIADRNCGASSHVFAVPEAPKSAGISKEIPMPEITGKEKPEIDPIRLQCSLVQFKIGTDVLIPALTLFTNSDVGSRAALHAKFGKEFQTLFVLTRALSSESMLAIVKKDLRKETLP